MTQHSIIGMSEAPRWGACAGSVTAQLWFPQTEESEAAAEGTAAHEVAVWLFHGYDVQEGMQTSNGVQVDEEMIEFAGLYVDHIKQIIATNPGCWFGLETMTHARRIHPEAWGTTDFWLYNQAAGLLYIRDFKYGHKTVEVHDNDQLIGYATGRMDDLGMPDLGITLDLGVIQPRAFHADGVIRTVCMPATDIRPHVNRLAGMADEALGSNPRFITGPHCADCLALHACKAARQASMMAVDHVAQGPQVEHMDDASSASEYLLLKRSQEAIESRLKAKEAELLSRIREGHTVPGLVAENKRGLRRWVVSADQVIALGNMLGVNLAKPPKAITPRQAEKAGIDENVTKQYSETPVTGLKLVPDSKSRAVRAFKGDK